MARSIEGQIKSTYFTLRVALAVLAFALPPLLWVGGKIAGFPLRDSMSAYYWATPTQQCPCREENGICVKKDQVDTVMLEDPTQAKTLQAGTMRNIFVGFLFAVGAILYVYKGYTKGEDYALNFAGIMAVGVALFPTPWDCDKHPFTIHGACAILFFLAIAFVCAFCSETTLVLLDPRERARYRIIYRILAAVMVASPAVAYGFIWVTSQKQSFIFWAEAFGIYSFSIYWVIKIREISSIGSERRAIERDMAPAIGD